MNYYLIFCIILLCCIGIIIILISNYKTRTKTLLKVQNEKYELEKLKKEELKEYFKEEWKTEEEKLNLKISGLESTLKEKEKRYDEVNQDLDLYRSGKIKEIDSAAAEYEQRKQLIVDKGIEEYRNFTNEFFNSELELQKEQIEQVKEQKEDLLKDIETVKAELEVERSKRAAINEEIRRAKEVEMKQDFYRIRFSEEDKNDVEILRSIAPRLRHPEAVNKVIWSAYYQKPLAELRKRVAIEGSGIYKITRIKTGEIYIGQARNVSTRFAEHCKAALGVGTLASSQLHRAMQSDGCENFLFELLEEVPVEKLKEKESYYIDFYDSKNYGLNTIRGEQNK